MGRHSAHHPSGTLPGNEEEASPHGTAMSADVPDFTVPVLCPLCLSAPVVNPVLLHGASMAKFNGDRKTTTRPGKPAGAYGQESVACVACRSCAQKWAPVFFQEGKHHDCPQCGDTMDKPSVFAFTELARVSVLPTALRNPVVAGVMESEDSYARNESVSFSLVDAVEQWKSDCSAAEAVAGVLHACKEKSDANEESNALCGACEEAKGEVMCMQCDFALCAECQATTHSKGRFKLHEVLPLAEAHAAKKKLRQTRGTPSPSQSSATGRRPHRMCSLHTQQSLDLYCRTCNVCICVTCCFGGDHKGDDVVPLADIAETTRTAAHRFSEEMATTARASEETSKQLALLTPAYDEEVAKTESQIRNTFAMLRDALTRREETLLGELTLAKGHMRTGMESQARLSDDISAALRTSEKRLDAFLTSTDNVTLMELLPAITGGHQALHSLAARLSSEAYRAEKRLSASLTDKAVFHLFPLDSVEGDEGKAVEEYAKLLASLGQLDAQAEYPSSSDRAASQTRDSEHPASGVSPEGVARDYRAEQDDATRGVMGSDDISPLSGTATERRAAEDFGAARESTMSHPSHNAIAATSKRRGPVEEASLVNECHSVSVASTSKKSTSTLSASAREQRRPSPFAADAMTSAVPPASAPIPRSLDGGRTTEAHTSSRPHDADPAPLTTTTTAATATVHPTTCGSDDWPVFGASARSVQAALAPLTSTEAEPPASSNRKRMLELSFDRSFGETLNATMPAPRPTTTEASFLSNGGSGLERFSHSSLFSGRSTTAATLDSSAPSAYRPTLEWEPATKVSRLDAAMDAFVSKTNGATLSASPEKKPPLSSADEKEVSKPSSALHLQLRI